VKTTSYHSNRRSINLYHREVSVPYNLRMDKDKMLDDFVQILGRIADLTGAASMSDDKDIDLDKAIEKLRLSGNDEGADELAELVKRADELKAQHQAKS
jgi:hypothetical protein